MKWTKKTIGRNATCPKYNWFITIYRPNSADPKYYLFEVFVLHVYQRLFILLYCFFLCFSFPFSHRKCVQYWCWMFTLVFNFIGKCFYTDCVNCRNENGNHKSSFRFYNAAMVFFWIVLWIADTKCSKVGLLYKLLKRNTAKNKLVPNQNTNYQNERKRKWKKLNKHTQKSLLQNMIFKWENHEVNEWMNGYFQCILIFVINSFCCAKIRSHFHTRKCRK